MIWMLVSMSTLQASEQLNPQGSSAFRCTKTLDHFPLHIYHNIACQKPTVFVSLWLPVAQCSTEYLHSSSTHHVSFTQIHHPPLILHCERCLHALQLTPQSDGNGNVTVVPTWKFQSHALGDSIDHKPRREWTCGHEESIECFHGVSYCTVTSQISQRHCSLQGRE